MFCQKSIAARIVERGGDYIPPVKDNQKNLCQNIETVFTSRFFPLVSFESAVENAHGRSEQRAIDVLPSKVAGI